MYIKLEPIYFFIVGFMVGYLLFKWGYSMHGTNSMGDATNAPIPVSGLLTLMGIMIMFIIPIIGATSILPDNA